MSWSQHFSQERDGREADQSVIVADAVLLPSESSRRMEQEDCDRIAMDKLGKPSAGDQWSFTKIMFYIIFGYLSLAQVRQEVNSILKGALAPPPEDAARTAFVAPDAPPRDYCSRGSCILWHARTHAVVPRGRGKGHF